ncbi:prephenate dehydratase [Salsuginibacillus kocurii]|uniref:prephenate dehydratase n=1 Tax=Salsuginibacillus kocurii TaxID=427078 RepID=UPI00037666F2|nr:prephenate dehydratase [Salsuginibacillus kocurii]
MPSVGYLGPQGTFTELAVDAVFSAPAKQGFKTIPAVMDAVSDGTVESAVVPLENAIEGSVNLTLDHLIHKKDLPIVGEVTVPIEQHLLIANDELQDFAKIEKVYSHPHAIAQCHEFLQENVPDAEIIYMNSTGEAAKKIEEEQSKTAAVIANMLAAKLYRLTVAQANIHDYEHNHTRFVVLTKPDHKQTLSLKDGGKTGEKTTLMVTLPSDYSGALHHVLSAFAWRRLNLSKIESRPMKTGLGHYFFVIDVDQGMDEVLMPGVIEELKALQCGVRVLGTYPCYTLQAQDSKKEETATPK